MKGEDEGERGTFLTTGKCFGFLFFHVISIFLPFYMFTCLYGAEFRADNWMVCSVLNFMFNCISFSPILSFKCPGNREFHSFSLKKLLRRNDFLHGAKLSPVFVTVYFSPTFLSTLVS